MKINRASIALILSGIAVIAVAVIGRPTVPLYDGVNFPDEPYRYADPAHKPKSKPPISPSMIFLRPDAVNGISMQSNEVGPQIVVYVSPSAIILSPETKQAKLTAQALTPTVQPGDGKIAGNVYRISGSADTGSFTITKPSANSYSYINLRLPQGFPPNPAFEFRPPDGTWHKIDSTKIGNDIYESTQINSFGDYALVKLNKPAQSSGTAKKHSNTGTFAAAGLAALVVFMAGIIVLIRRDQEKKSKTK
ncbi:MAG TPA: hypothetical protein VLG47_06730 [Candidatus Saccharimonadales bacterium]|nr:hypothetical protein [Candidatus Saccharimonadales bacterium]